MMERIARFCVGVGVVWAAGVIVVGLVAGFDRPGAMFRLLDDLVGQNLRWGLYLALALFVVPVGMLSYLHDVLSDPLPLWMKAATPGALAAIYALFLAAALPEVGLPLLRYTEPVASTLVPASALRTDLEATWSWLVRFGAAFVVLAGIPGLLGAAVALLAGLGSSSRR